MSITTQIALLWLAFTATHIGLASSRVEPRLRAKLGGPAFLGLYSLVALAIFLPLAQIYFSNRHAGVWLWAISVGPLLRAALYALMTIGLVLTVGSFVKPSPAVHPCLLRSASPRCALRLRPRATATRRFVIEHAYAPSKMRNAPGKTLERTR